VCTVVVLRDTAPGLPLVVAANRDELYTRPTDGPRRIGDAIVGGIDRVSGGTWMGATPDGLVVALTNQRTARMPDPTRRSRGEVVLAALASGSRAAALAYATALDPADYNGFNLILGDAGGVDVVHVHPGEPVDVVPLPPGVTVIANDRIGSPEFPRADHAAALAARVADEPWPRLATSLAGILADHTPPPPERTPMPPPGSPFTREDAARLQALCIHTPRYGTRHGAITAVSHAGLAGYLVCLDAPCRSPFVDIDRLV
jgi:uncharacterized protein with NRDE domain